MLIAKLRVGIENSGISYNAPPDVGLAASPQTTVTGGIVRGLGTHFESAAAMERYQRLTKAGTVVRARFERMFLRTPIDGTFIINERGQAKKFVADLEIEPGLVVSATEFELGVANGGLDNKEMADWAEKVKAQLNRVPLGREKDQVDDDGLKTLESLALCPALSETTREAIKVLIAGVRVGTINKVDFKRSISLLNVEMDQTPLQPRRVGPVE